MTGRRSHPTGSRRRFPAVLALLVLAGALLGVMGVGAGSAGAQSSAAADQGCSRVEVLLMIDQSASLRNTDPQDLRIAAAEGLLRSLAASAEAGGPTVNVTVAAFGTDAVEVGRATLPGGVDGAVEIVRPFADRETDLNTDYVLALGFAVRHFQSITDLPSSCKRLVWFTDGAYSIDRAECPGRRPVHDLHRPQRHRRRARWAGLRRAARDEPPAGAAGAADPPDRLRTCSWSTSAAVAPRARPSGVIGRPPRR